MLVDMFNFKYFAFVFTVAFKGLLESATWNCSDLSSSTSEYPQIALSSDGSHAIIVLQSFDEENYIIRAVTSTDGGNTWTTPIDISVCGHDSVQPQISLSSNGKTAIVIYEKSYGDFFVVQAVASNDGGASWTKPVSLASSALISENYTISVSDDGSTAIVLWKTQNNLLAIRTSDGGATWGPTVVVSSCQQLVSSPCFAMSSDGSHAIAVWVSFDGVVSSIKAITTADSGLTWGDIVNLNQNLDPGQPKIALTSNGLQAVVVWENYGVGTCFIQSVQTSDGGITWSAPLIYLQQMNILKIHN